MLDRVKSALIESYVGVIAVGWLLAEGTARLVTSFTTPLTEWMINRMRQQDTPGFHSLYGPQPHFLFQLMIPQLIAAVLLLLVGLLLLRWLYLSPSGAEIPAAQAERDA